jgi:hypothetical protein
MRQNGVRSNVRFPYSKGKSAKKQAFKDRRDESYGKWGKRKAGKVNK